jgi:tRNA dimethylallyltransferase
VTGATTPFIAILGPTASGKSALACELAAHLSADLISCDSMQVYRGLDIGTAKPSLMERQRIPHHLIDLLDIHEPWDANRHAVAARRLLDAARRAGRPVILVGGTGMYAKTVIYDLPLEPSDKHLAAEIEAVWREHGAERLLAEVAACSRPLADKVGENPRRLLRTVEIIRLTGAPPQWWQKTLNPGLVAAPDWCQLILMPEPAYHRQAILERTQEMLGAGWIEEARRLYAHGLDQTPTARQALGYGAIRDYLDGRLASVAELTTRIGAQTWQYARRQKTWFRHQHPGARLVTLPTAPDRQRLVMELISRFRTTVRP